MLIFTFNSFGQVDEALIKKDLESIKIDYPEKWFLTYSFQANNLAVYSWDDEPRFIWFSDYDAYLNNKTIMKSYEVDSPSKINLRENLKIKFDFERPSNIDYNNLNYLIARKGHMEGIKNTTSLDDFVLIKCYEELCVYGKENEELVSRYTST